MKIFEKMAIVALSFGLASAFAQSNGDVVIEDDGVVGNYGAITVKNVNLVRQINGKDSNVVMKIAYVSSESTETVDVPEDIEVDSVYYDRDYSGEWMKPGTLMLPFDFPSGCLLGAQIYEMTGIGINGQNTWQIDTKNMGSNGEFVANRPYFVRPSEKRIYPQQYCAATTLKKTRGVNTTVAFDEWELRGMYSYKVWEEGDSDIGRVYGFAAKEKVVDGKTIQEGQFVRVKAGAKIRPFRAYLMYNKSAALTKAGANATIASIEEDLPSSIEVVFHDDEETTAIYMLNPRTGEFSTATGWYDMKGRKLGKKPTVKGTYFYNGNRVVIK